MFFVTCFVFIRDCVDCLVLFLVINKGGIHVKKKIVVCVCVLHFSLMFLLSVPPGRLVGERRAETSLPSLVPLRAIP